MVNLNKVMETNLLNQYGLIRTLGEDDEIENSDVESLKDEEEEPEPETFSSNFKFDIEESQETPAWNDIRKYIRPKASTLEEKIARIREERRQQRRQKQIASTEASTNEIKIVSTDSGQETNNGEASTGNGGGEEEEDSDSEVENIVISSSDNEGKSDVVKVKKKKRRRSMFQSDKVITFDDDLFGEEIEYDPSMTFQQMNLSRPLQKAITAMNFLRPTPIQASTIPIALMGRDIYGCAATGTGKTAAFMLPVLERLLFKPKDKPVTRVLVILPTRELAVQVYQVSKQLAQFTKVEIALSAGGLELKVQEQALRRFPDVIIATPGRLIDHLENTPSFSLHSIEILILDEADRILDEYFAEQMQEIIKQCAYSRQTMLFSATLNDDVKDLAASVLKEPVKIFINTNTEVALNLYQEFIRIRANKESEREAILAALLQRTFQDHVMVFAQTKAQVHRLFVQLSLLGVRVAELRGNLNQAQRFESLRKFKEDEVDVLVATDVAARGLDIPGVKTVINFTLPCTLQHYIHRVGRTARAGKIGRSVSMVGEQERKLLKEIVKEARNPVKHRLIPPEIVSRNVQKLTALEVDLSRVMREEKEEQEMQKVEKKVKHTEDRLTGKEEKAPQRNWFQTRSEQIKERNTLRLGDLKKRKKKGTKPTTEDRMDVELLKAAQFRARQMKKSLKPKRIRAIDENETKKPRPKKNKQKHSFHDELGDTSTLNVKKMRNEAKHHERMEHMKKMRIKRNQANKKINKSKTRHKKRR